MAVDVRRAEDTKREREEITEVAKAGEGVRIVTMKMES